MVKSFALNNDDWDLFLDVDGNIAVTSGRPRIVQDVACSAGLWLGESIMHTDEGVPYRQEILGRAVEPQLVRAYLRQQALKVPNVTDADVLDAEPLENRTLRPDIRITDDLGA